MKGADRHGEEVEKPPAPKRARQPMTIRARDARIYAWRTLRNAGWSDDLIALGMRLDQRTLQRYAKEFDGRIVDLEWSCGLPDQDE